MKYFDPLDLGLLERGLIREGGLLLFLFFSPGFLDKTIINRAKASLRNILTNIYWFSVAMYIIL